MTSSNSTTDTPDGFFSRLTGRGIEYARSIAREQEAYAQKDFIESDKLPNVPRRERAAYEAMGIVFGEVDSDDSIFVHATLPFGWAKVRSSDEYPHDSYILDEESVRRVQIHYSSLVMVGRSASMRVMRLPIEIPGGAFRAHSENLSS